METEVRASKRKRSKADATSNAEGSVRKWKKIASGKVATVQAEIGSRAVEDRVTATKFESVVGDDHQEGEAKSATGFKAKEKHRLQAHIDGSWDTWNVPAPVGGYLLDIDPILSTDDEHLLLAYESSIRVYARATSLLLRTLQTSSKGSITDFAISPQNPNQLYICETRGLIEQWDWVVGTRLGLGQFKQNMHGLQVFNLGSTKDTKNIVLTTSTRKDKWMITAHRLRGRTTGDKDECETIFTSKEPVSCLEVLGNGQYIVAASGKRLIVGTRDSNKDLAVLTELVYVWREVHCSDNIISLNSRLAEERTEVNTGAAKKRSAASLDIVVGSSKGPLFLYRDIVTHLIRVEQRKQPSPITSRLHWHRTGVTAVKWSIDGNYLISGGSETVLVLWQIDTGHQQVLPHLSAPIESIVVSSTGSSYAVRLGDNSAMVLSTSELQPTANVSGILVPFHKHRQDSGGEVRVGHQQDEKELFNRRPAISCLTTRPSHLLLAAPAAISSPSALLSSRNCSYLQTFDPGLGIQISKQALVRTKTTDRNQGPEGNVIDEPNIVLLQVSRDSKWLATVEEWMPPPQDLHRLASSLEETLHLQDSRLEIYLKFWSRNEELGRWELVSRIDDPHANRNQSASSIGAILDLIAHPTRVGFITLGDEGLIKIWKPSLRMRTGTKVKSKSGEALTSWGSRQAIPLPAWDVPLPRQPCQNASRIAISADGSLLAVAHSTNPSSIIYTVNLRNEKVLAALPNIFSGPVVGVGLIDRYIIVISDHLSIWDLVDQQSQYVMDLSTSKSSHSAMTKDVHLALDQQKGTFALSLPMTCQSNAKSALVIVDPSKRTTLFFKELHRPLMSLTSAETVRSYYGINDLGEVYVFTPKVMFSQNVESLEIEAPPAATGLQNMFGNGKRLVTSKEQTAQESRKLGWEKASENDYPSEAEVSVIRDGQLTKLWGHLQPFALPPMHTLFQQVAELVIGKTQG